MGGYNSNILERMFYFKEGQKCSYIKERGIEMTRSNKYKVTSPARFFIFVLLTTFILIMSVYSILANPSQAASATVTYKLITVRENDTLWDIALEYGPSNMNTYDIIQEICDTNDITAGDISSGDMIFVPIEINR